MMRPAQTVSWQLRRSCCARLLFMLGCPKQRAALRLRACSKSSPRVPCFAKAVCNAQSTKHGTKTGQLPDKHLQHGRCRFCNSNPSGKAANDHALCCTLAKTGRDGQSWQGVRRDPGQLLHWRTHAKTLSRLLGCIAHHSAALASRIGEPYPRPHAGTHRAFT